jgi:cullin 3
MKSKREIPHNELISEVLNNITNLFLPDINAIKQRIESLIERGYVKRSPNDYNNYIYES